MIHPEQRTGFSDTAVACCAPLGAPVLFDEEALATAQVFGALADPHRVRIVNLVAYAGGLAEAELIEPLGCRRPPSPTT